MRVKVIGESESARTLRGLLRKAGFAVTEFLPADTLLNGPLAGYVVRLEEHAYELVEMDSTESELEKNILHHLAALSKTSIVLTRAGGVVHNDCEIRIVVPERTPNLQMAVELAVMRGLLDTVASSEKVLPTPRRGFWRRLFHLPRRKL